MERDPLARALKGLSHFHLLGPASLDRIAAHARTRSLSAGEAIFFERDPALAFYAVQSGGVKLYRLGPDGREQVVHSLGRGATFGEAAVFNLNVYPVNAMATESPTELIEISGEPIQKMLLEDDRIAKGMIASLSMRLLELVERVEGLTSASAEARLARYVLKLPATGPSSRPKVDLRVAKQDLAAGLKIPLETFSRVLRKWEQDGLVASANRTLALLDPGKLQAIADGDGAARWLVNPL